MELRRGANHAGQRDPTFFGVDFAPRRWLCAGAAMARPNTPLERKFLENLTICFFLCVGIWIVFGQTKGFDFVNYDDDQYVYDNTEVRKGLTAQSVSFALKTPQVANWIPLTTLSHMLDCQLFGLDAGAHHLVNVAWHAGTAMLLFLVLRALTGALWRSAFVAGVFAAHPLRAESVAWIAERKDVLSGFFFMLTLAAYVRHARRPTAWTSAVVIALFCLGLLCKNMLITLPVVLLLLDYWPLRRFSDRKELGGVFAEKDPLMVLAIAWAGIGTLVPGLVIGGDYRVSIPARIGNALVSYAIYLRQLLWPSGLVLHYPYAPHGPPWWEALGAAALLAAITWWAVARRREQPYLIVGWLWYVVMLLPVIGLVQISADAAHADRYTYLPEIGLTLAITWAVAEALERMSFGRWAGAALGGAAWCALIVGGRMQTAYWKDSETIWRRTIARVPDDEVAHENLGLALATRHLYPAAIDEYRKAEELDPRSSTLHSNFAEALEKTGQPKQAEEECQKALKIDPEDTVAYLVLGKIYARQGNERRAIEEYRMAAWVDPDNLEAQRTLRLALVRQADARGRVGGPKL